MSALFQPGTESLLQLVINGNYNAAKKLLASLQNPSAIIIDSIPGKEQNGRTWRAVSPLEFAAWAGDVTKDDDDHGMLNLLLQYVSDEDKQAALNQLSHVMEKGTEQGEFLSPYKTLTKEYDVFKINYAQWNSLNRDDHWIKAIGLAQKLLPMVGIQEFCDPQPFTPLPDFKKAPHRSCKLADGSVLVLDSTSGLGSTFALYKGPVRLSGVAVRLRGAIAASRGTVVDSAPIIHFCEIKTDALHEQIKMLQPRTALLQTV